MRDTDWVEFLQWCLPRMEMRWAGFRKVRRQVCRRIGRRLEELSLEDLQAYRDVLARRPREWEVLEGLCRVTISHFYRDRVVFDLLGRRILPELAGAVRRRGGRLRCWSAGCASGKSRTPSASSGTWVCRRLFLTAIMKPPYFFGKIVVIISIIGLFGKFFVILCV